MTKYLGIITLFIAVVSGHNAETCSMTVGSQADLVDSNRSESVCVCGFLSLKT